MPLATDESSIPPAVSRMTHDAAAYDTLHGQADRPLPGTSLTLSGSTNEPTDAGAVSPDGGGERAAGSRVLHVTEATGAGVLSYITMVANRQAANGSRVGVLMLGDRPDRASGWREAFDPAIQVTECRSDAGLLGRLGAYLHAIRRGVLQFRPDALHLHSSIAGALARIAVPTAAMRSVASIVYQPHGVSYMREDVSAPTRFAYFAAEWLLSLTRVPLIGVSVGEQSVLRRLPGAVVHLIENGVQAEEIPVRVPRPEPSRLRIGTVNRICAQKDPQFFAEVARLLPADRFELIWIGDGDADLRAVLASSGVDVRGWLPRAQALAELATFDLYLQPSRWEGMPLSLIEAQVAGVPAVARDVIGNREILARTGGGRLATSASQAAAELLALAEAPALRQALGARARTNAIEAYSMDRIAGQLDALYRSAARPVR